MKGIKILFICLLFSILFTSCKGIEGKSKNVEITNKGNYYAVELDYTNISSKEIGNEYAKEILNLCKDKIEAFDNLEEGGSFNDRNSELTEEDSLEAYEVIDKEQEKERIKALTKDAEKLQEESPEL